jgi:hypothetical protein
MDIAFESMMERYSREEMAAIVYHVHIPAPDPMTNPSTEARARFYEAWGTPAFAIDGAINTGGGGRDQIRAFYDRVNPQLEQRLSEPAGARILLGASRDGGQVNVEATVDKVRNESHDLSLQIALVEDRLTYSGQNGVRFHPMVVRSLAGKDAAGFGIGLRKKMVVRHTFDLGEITRELKAHLDDYEKERKVTFIRKMHEIDGRALSVAAFVQDAKTREVLQAAFVKVTNDARPSRR